MIRTHDTSINTKGSRPPIVVKLGGSTSSARVYQRWLNELRVATQKTARSVVIVPGGGPFADVIRSTQGTVGFDDATAHDLAILSMNQFGRVLLQHAHSARALTAADLFSLPPSQSSSLPAPMRLAPLNVWLPDPESLATSPGIEKSWRTTGDTLACWLCEQLGTADLIIIKSVEARVLNQPLSMLSKQGIIDDLSEQTINALNLNVQLLGVDDIDTLINRITTMSPDSSPDNHSNGNWN